MKRRRHGFDSGFCRLAQSVATREPGGSLYESRAG
jgi:hypothetical protein